MTILAPVVVTVKTLHTLPTLSFRVCGEPESTWGDGCLQGTLGPVVPAALEEHGEEQGLCFPQNWPLGGEDGTGDLQMKFGVSLTLLSELGVTPR